jgi:hypothetical protein
MLGIAFTGGGKRDSDLPAKQKETAMFVSHVQGPARLSFTDLK